MTLGTYNRHQAERKKEAALRVVFPQGIRCQKCLEYGHWSYECKGKRKILTRPSRTQIMKKNLKATEEAVQCSGGQCKIPNKKKRKSSASNSDSSSSSSDSSSDSETDSNDLGSTSDSDCMSCSGSSSGSQSESGSSSGSDSSSD